ncbi:hypothetical protein PHSY_003071 [Pseudozyma hubeiensis SY62]|uniref:Uncharacterized protein n=1 Tax=Pseudozyma hubeiensis (strain SY62) TaxID=1305764 RepID=R9PBP2_PSEHS|nr:hypothetical protein PHSY_003071 [Pseudozyma hubeiensis SY62]GAC95495.1 hypothetical protein PHSY_003071 [Pseudozyma hubeiensis SY62]
MSSQTGTGAPAQAQPHARTKKNSIGSWFSKKFGRRASDAANGSNDVALNGQSRAGGTVPARKNPPKEDGQSRTATLPTISGGAQRATAAGQQPQFASAFASDSAQGLANTLGVPGREGPAHGRLTPPPQLDGIPTQEPLGAIDLPRSPRPDPDVALTEPASGTLSPSTITNQKALDPPIAGPIEQAAQPSVSQDQNTGQISGAAPAIPSAIISGRAATNTRIEPDTDNDSSIAARDSIGNRTIDTSKSRASTKPTTLMSLDTREPAVLPTTHIAQPRQNSGDDSFGASQRHSTGPRDGSAIQFVPDSGYSSTTGQISNASGTTAEGATAFISVPTHSRPHPNNNPHPSAIPADNASILTLASSSAGISLGGASRSYHHAPSMGGARSIGGSLMGDRRNSSDTSASLKALPPLSRRGSDSSSRTRDSIPASSTGQNSHQAMYASGAFAGPGAPSDRVSLHRTPSQKTVATQLSVPLSASASNPALQAYAKSEHTANGSQLHLPGSQASHVTTEPEAGGVLAASETGHSLQSSERALEPSASADLVNSELTAQAADASDELLKTQAGHLAATEHDEALRAAAGQHAGEGGGILDVVGPVKKEEPFDVPGGPPVA